MFYLEILRNLGVVEVVHLVHHADGTINDGEGAERSRTLAKTQTEMQQRLARRYEELFRIYLKHADSIDRVTFWGVADGMSWLNNFPVRGRTDYPLLFDRSLKPKPCAAAVLRLAEEAPVK